MSSSLLYPAIAFVLLGIERFVYGYVFHFPQDFIRRCKSGQLGSAFEKETLYWKNFMTLGIYVKVFQFSVLLYDLLVKNTIQFNVTRFIVGATLLVAGQSLNMAAYNALGCIGIYYGHEMGHKVPRVTSFPYNLGLSDPQYWGVVATVVGLYVMLNAQSMLVPYLELFWYFMSMKVLEHSNGKAVLKALSLST
jgi:hypothetical protein